MCKQTTNHGPSDEASHALTRVFSVVPATRKSSGQCATRRRHRISISPATNTEPRKLNSMQTFGANLQVSERVAIRGAVDGKENGVEKVVEADASWSRVNYTSHCSRPGKPVRLDVVMARVQRNAELVGLCGVVRQLCGNNLHEAVVIPAAGSTSMTGSLRCPQVHAHQTRHENKSMLPTSFHGKGPSNPSIFCHSRLYLIDQESCTRGTLL